MFLWSGNGEDAFYALAGGVMRRAGPNGAPMRNAKAPFFHLPVGSSARLGQRQRGRPPARTSPHQPDTYSFRSLRARISLRAMSKVFPFSSLPTADLVIDAVYEGGTKGNTADDVLGKLIPGAGNQGGFRAVGSWDAPRVVILYSSMDDPDWPDFIDIYTGVFTYFGDNKKPGHDLHDTPRRGNRLLQSCFATLYDAPDRRVKIPPFLVFTKGQKGRDVVFRGLAVPGVEADPADDLVAHLAEQKGGALPEL